MLLAFGDALVDGGNLGVDVVYVLGFFLRHPALRLQIFFGFGRIFIGGLRCRGVGDGLRAGGGGERDARAKSGAEKWSEWNRPELHALFPDQRGEAYGAARGKAITRTIDERPRS